MEKERCKIFCIYFKREDPEDCAEKLLKEIAEIGGSDNYFNSDSLESLYNTFDKISDAIQTSYKLKLDE